VKDLVIEFILIATIAVPMLATSLQPARAIDPNRSGVLKRLRLRRQA
jgi:hypothetical protein